MAAETRSFQAEVSKLLHIVANALYSEREVFLRELISNAADACDKLRFLAISDPDLTADDSAFKIRISADEKAKTLTLSDNGVGMTEAELHDNLGTIARSGTSAFVDEISGDAKKDTSLIGQFGVGFYSAFMVADKVEVLTRKAGESTGWLWTSDGLGEYTVAPAEKATRGTIITLHLKKDAKEFLEKQRLQTIVRTYSDHIPFPVVFVEGEDEDTLNQASALWTRPKSEISDDDYKEFYHHVGHAFDDPWMTVHWKAEGRIEYHGLLFVPSQRPFDLFHPERRHHVKLYVKRVFITDEIEGLVPSWLRFLKGVVDCEDLPLNVSREMLQHNPVVATISKALTKRVLGDLAKKAKKEPEAYAEFWRNFGAVLKEGLYADGAEHKEALLDLVRFKSTAGDELASLDGYIERMKEGQEAIYYIAAEDEAAAKASPQLEGFVKKGVEVLFLTDPIDEFWVQTMFDGVKGKPLKSITRGGADLAAIKSGDAEKKSDAETKDDEAKDTGLVDGLIVSVKLALGATVKDVRTTDRLSESPVCLVADETDMDMNLERMLRQHKQLDQAAPRVLEVNPDHALIKGLAKLVQDGRTDGIEDAAHLLFEQARILEGEPVSDPKAFTRRFSEVMVKALGA
ncbi:molecular chaperone HtpG [Thalassobaculum litoreum]|uniref:Chaperone protein HtpG n=1 Tax=Thalassobaculum litoreum DSM 18839 TaxID=1123362 RepID=A0A8G2BM53_9PROT|nr:molecular chaperone HtpG [Thalassobaculum litoreum]SDG49903.1 molecular chaperone HtpG [Thalassobaculum litoreum DSM 18839]